MVCMSVTGTARTAWISAGYTNGRKVWGSLDVNYTRADKHKVSLYLQIFFIIFIL